MDRVVIKCKDLAQVREEIDKIDLQLIELLAIRSNYVIQAGGFKKNPEQVKAKGRVEEVISRIRKEALAKGLNQDLAEALWREMIKQFTNLEMKHLG
ncbi:MAG: chorismate mutase [Spirochaetales bacterium]|nr:chorismate mutase [Spirochaetales bacterium]